MKHKYKICVYAISKNEEKFVKRWYESMSEADEIYVLDTGSTDNTVKLLDELGVYVYEKVINPWRFDVARNESLSLVPDDADICICTDLDEFFDKGWRDELEKIWQDGTTRIKYNLKWNYDNNSIPSFTYNISKIHSRKGFRWIYPVHEILESTDKANIIDSNKIIINHFPDKNKDRKSYLELLELAVMEDNNNDRNMHYLGREYMYYHRWNDAIDTLIKHLSLESATWKEERAASMRFIARCYTYMNRYDEAIMWLNKAIDETNYLREGYVELGRLYYFLKNDDECIKYLEKALEIKEKSTCYINEEFCWDSTIYDILSISYFNKEDYQNAYKYISLACDIDKNNKRLMDNLNIISKYIKK